MRWLACCLLLSSCSMRMPALRTQPDPPSTGLPNRALTPGAVVVVPLKTLCTPGYSTSVRNVPESVKRQAYAEYGIKTHKTGEYEVDHLISLELGGSNDLKNLWPQSYSGAWNAHVKDALENRLHTMVCAGSLTLIEAQDAIRTDWVAEYKKVFGVKP